MKQPILKILKALKQPSHRGFSLIEILLAAAILTFALCAILAAFISCLMLSSTSKNVNIATNVALEIAEQIRSSPFTDVRDSLLVINGQPFTETFPDSDIYRCSFPVAVLPSNMVTVYVDTNNPELLEVTISACWKQGNRIIGEDRNLNGTLEAGEDSNNNDLIDSPVQVVTRIANR